MQWQQVKCQMWSNYFLYQPEPWTPELKDTYSAPTTVTPSLLCTWCLISLSFVLSTYSLFCTFNHLQRKLCCVMPSITTSVCPDWSGSYVPEGIHCEVKGSYVRIWKTVNAVPLMTFMARLAPDLRDPDTVCLNNCCSLNSPARWEIFGKLLTKLLNFSEQSIKHGSVTLKPM